MPNLLEKEFQYFINHQDELVKKFNNKFIIIIDNNVEGAYDDIADAYIQTTQKFKPGTFLIQHCINGKEAYSQTFNSRAIFA